MGQIPLVAPPITPENRHLWERFLVGLVVNPPKGHGWRDLLRPLCFVRGHRWELFVPGYRRCARCRKVKRG